MKSTTLISASNNDGSRSLVGRWISVIGLVISLTGPQTVRADTFDLGDIPSWQFASPGSAEKVAISVATQLLPALVLNDSAFAQRLGFIDAAEVSSPPLSIGAPYPIFIVSLQRLIDYDPQQQSPIWLLLSDTNFLSNPVPFPARFLFPIQATGSAVKTSVLVHMPPPTFRWEVFRIGSPELIKLLTNYGNARRYFVISIPALNRYYLGKIEGSLFTIKTVFPDPIGIGEGQEVDAELVFTKLQVEAAGIVKPAPR